MAAPIDPIALFYVSSSIIAVILVFMIIGVFRSKIKNLPITVQEAQKLGYQLVLKLNNGRKHGMYKRLEELHPEFKVNTVRQLLSPNSNYPNPQRKLEELINTLTGKKTPVK